MPVGTVNSLPVHPEWPVTQRCERHMGEINVIIPESLREREALDSVLRGHGVTVFSRPGADGSMTVIPGHLRAVDLLIMVRNGGVCAHAGDYVLHQPEKCAEIIEHSR